MSASARWPSDEAERLEAVLCSRNGFCMRAIPALEVQLCSQGAGLGSGGWGEGRVLLAALAQLGGGAGGVPTGRGRRCDQHRLGPRLAATLREARPSLAPDLPLGGFGGSNSSGTNPQTFPRAPRSFCLSWRRRRRLSRDPLSWPRSSSLTGTGEGPGCWGSARPMAAAASPRCASQGARTPA